MGVQFSHNRREMLLKDQGNSLPHRQRVYLYNTHLPFILFAAIIPVSPQVQPPIRETDNQTGGADAINETSLLLLLLLLLLHLPHHLLLLLLLPHVNRSPCPTIDQQQ